MGIIEYNKLVRDKIPEIILGEGNKYSIRYLNDTEYHLALKKKLEEEVGEYYKTAEIDELVDIVEVIYSLINYYGLTIDEFEKRRLSKKYEKGGFDKRIMLINVYD